MVKLGPNLGRALDSLIKARLPLMKNLLMPLGNTNANSIRNRCSCSKEKFWIGGVYTYNLKRRNERYIDVIETLENEAK